MSETAAHGSAASGVRKRALAPVIAWPLLLSALLLGSSARSQVEVPTPESDPRQPDPAALSSSWWTYFAEARDEQLDTRINETLASAQQKVSDLTVNDATEVINRLERLRQQFSVYQQVLAEPPPAAAPALRMDGIFTLVELFELIEEQRKVKSDIATLEEQRAERQRSYDAESRQLEALFSRYPRTAERTLERLRLGLEVMAQRVTMAITRVRKDRTVEQLRQRRQFAADLAAQRDYATDHLDFSEVAAEELQATLAGMDERISQAADRITAAQERSLSLQPASANLELRSQLVQMQIDSAEMDRLDARLLHSLTESQLRWLALHGSIEGPKELDIREDIDNWRALQAAAELDVEPWKTAAVAILLSNPVNDGTRQAEAQRLDREGRGLAQQNLEQVRQIQVKAEQLAVLADVVELKLAEQQGPLRRAWLETRIFLESLWRSSLKILNVRLFSIGDTPVTAMGIARIVVILIIAFWISVLIRRTLDRLSRTRAFISVSSIYTLGRLLHYLIMIAALLIGLGSIGLDFSNLALIAGALSVGIGFGLQSIVSNFVSGLILLFERSLKVGDYVELDSGLTGHVREINIRSTRINTNDNIDVLVPNSEFVTNRLTNWTLRESIARMRIPFGVAYGSDKEQVRDLALEAADKVEFTLKNMPGKSPEVWLVGFGDSSLDFELLIWVSRKGVARPGRIQAYYLWELHTVFTEHGIEIPFPQRDLHLRSADGLPGGKSDQEEV